MRGENKYPNELACPGGIAPLCTISKPLPLVWLVLLVVVVVGVDLIDPLLNYFFALFHFNRMH